MDSATLSSRLVVNDECRKRASQASCECMHLVIRASDFVIFSSFVIAYKAWRPKVALSN
jgi:hypothetical protein